MTKDSDPRSYPGRIDPAARKEEESGPLPLSYRASCFWILEGGWLVKAQTERNKGRSRVDKGKGEGFISLWPVLEGYRISIFERC